MAGKANPRFEHALTYAANAHAAVHQERKGTDFPYVVHPIRVAALLDQFGCSDHVVVAGFLHDTIEDAGVSESDICKEFDPRVASLVTKVSEPDKDLPWTERKKHTLAQLEQEQDPDVLALAAADKLDNVRSIADTLRHLGHRETWPIFNATQAEQRWYYRELAQTLLSKDPANGLFRLLHTETQTLFPAEETQ
jgi:(p)ppGpp synthase/HD superfamily hydrolase